MLNKKEYSPVISTRLIFIQTLHNKKYRQKNCRLRDPEGRHAVCFFVLSIVQESRMHFRCHGFQLRSPQPYHQRSCDVHHIFWQLNDPEQARKPSNFMREYLKQFHCAVKLDTVSETVYLDALGNADIPLQGSDTGQFGVFSTCTLKQLLFLCIHIHTPKAQHLCARNLFLLSFSMF